MEIVKATRDNFILKVKDESPPSQLLVEAINYATANSDDKFTKVGALMVTKTGHKIYSANMLPKGLEKTEERCDRPLKY
jgi:hypothetical protein